MNQPLQHISSDIVYLYFESSVNGPSGLSLTATQPVALTIYAYR